MPCSWELEGGDCQQQHTDDNSTSLAAAGQAAALVDAGDVDWFGCSSMDEWEAWDAWRVGLQSGAEGHTTAHGGAEPNAPATAETRLNLGGGGPGHQPVDNGLHFQVAGHPLDATFLVPSGAREHGVARSATGFGAPAKLHGATAIPCCIPIGKHHGPDSAKAAVEEAGAKYLGCWAMHCPNPSCTF
jgi:hypothetical protein